MTKLTKSTVERADTRAKPYFLFDSSLPGFCARIAPNGKRHYYLQYMKRKKVKRFMLGLHGILTAEAARDKAIAMLARINAGADPLEEKIQKALAPTVKDLSEKYMNEHVAAHCKQSTADGYRRYLDKRILPKLGDLKVSDVTRTDIAEFHQSLSEMPYEANRCMEVISKMFNLAELWGYRPDGSNPRVHLTKFQEEKRERYLTKDESKNLGGALTAIKNDKEKNPVAAYCIELLLYTGCRLSEIQTLKWEYIDRENSCLRLPDSKTGARVVYVGKNVMDLLTELENHPDRPEGNPYVLWGAKEGEHIKDMQKPWRNIRKKVGLNSVRIHDLRHSFASFAVSEGATLPMIGKLLGHTQVQTTARYAHLMADPVREAAGKISQGIAAAMQQQPQEAAA